MLKRTTINHIDNILKNNPNWNVLDIGCGYRANKNASVISDIQDFSNYYKDKKFVQIKGKNLPFKDKEFDFVISSHVIEHVEDFQFFIKELERVSSRGYIELPSRLGDNLVYENKKDHIWWFLYDDYNGKLLVSKRNQLVEPFINVSTAKFFEKIFRESLVLELLWEEKIEYKIDNTIHQHEVERLSFFKIVRKYLSKKIRSFYK